MANILVVDDEMGIRELLSEILGDEGHVVSTAEDANQARELRLSESPDLVLLDIWMPDTDGVTLLKEWQRDGLLTIPVIMMSGHATIDTALVGSQKLNGSKEHSLLPSDSPLSAYDGNNFPQHLISSSTFAPAGSEFRVSFELPLREARDAFERAYFEHHLLREGGSMTRVAERTGLERTHLYRKLKQLGVEPVKGNKKTE